MAWQQLYLWRSFRMEGSHERPRGSVHPKQAPNTVILQVARSGLHILPFSQAVMMLAGRLVSLCLLMLGRASSGGAVLLYAHEAVQWRPSH